MNSLVLSGTPGKGGPSEPEESEKEEEASSLYKVWRSEPGKNVVIKGWALPQAAADRRRSVRGTFVGVLDACRCYRRLGFLGWKKKKKTKKALAGEEDTVPMG
jgi:hypothetical protein